MNPMIRYFNTMKYCPLCIYFLLALTGCRLGPTYHSPTPETPEMWKNEVPECTDECPVFTGCWWSVFDDPTLNCLIESAIAYNPSIAAALDRVAQARAIAGVEKADLYPQLNLTPSFTDQGILTKLYLPPGGFGFPISENLRRPYRIHQYQLAVPLMMSYEVDFWGKIRGEYDSAVFNAESKLEDYYNVMLTLTTDLASSYFQMRMLDTRIASLKRNLEFLRKNYSIADSRFKKGIASELDVASAAQVLNTTEALLYDSMRQRTLSEDMIATLSGVPASQFFLETQPLDDMPPCIPPGMPADILMQRPDVAAAEATMRSTHAMIGVAYASFFPSLQLSAGVGFSSPTINDFLQWKSRLWNLAANAAQVVLDGGRNVSNLCLAYAQFSESSHQYQQTVLTAFQEVEDALASLKFQALQYDSNKLAFEAASKRVEISNRRYNQGFAGYLDVINSEQNAIQIEISLIDSLGARYLSTINLIKALGGCW